MGKGLSYTHGLTKKLNHLVYNVPLKGTHIIFDLNKSVKRKKNPRIDGCESGINDSSQIEQTLVLRSRWFS